MSSIKLFLISGALIVGSLNHTGCSNSAEAEPVANYSDQAISAEAINELPLEDVSPGEMNGLVFMREEEKLARDVYLTLHEQWGRRVFANISKSEQRHTDAIKYLLLKYEISDPVTEDSLGVFKHDLIKWSFIFLDRCSHDHFCTYRFLY